MKRITHIAPVIYKEVSLGIQYILMSEVRGEVYVLSEDEIRFIKKFGRPEKWGLYSCIMDEVSDDSVTDQQVPFCDTPMKRSYEICHHSLGHATMVIDWNA